MPATPSSPSVPPTFSNTDLPTLSRPTAPPRLPTDQITGEWVLGTVTRGGDGPCYGLQADDGRLLALRGAGAGTLNVGDRIRARVMVPLSEEDCGEGVPMTLLEIKPAV